MGAVNMNDGTTICDWCGKKFVFHGISYGPATSGTYCSKACYCAAKEQREKEKAQRQAEKAQKAELKAEKAARKAAESGDYDTAPKAKRSFKAKLLLGLLWAILFFGSLFALKRFTGILPNLEVSSMLIISLIGFVFKVLIP